MMCGVIDCLDLPYILPNLAKIINYSRDIDAIHKPEDYIGRFIKSGSILSIKKMETLRAVPGRGLHKNLESDKGNQSANSRFLRGLVQTIFTNYHSPLGIFIGTIQKT
jgi:hypothetical protein